ncbi:MAG: M24 family metallopeptidase [SAR324 cluster bacterium]|jgi:creatinase|nr:creatininase [Deltaproteobacteria bacterium]MDP6091103.1 M24 family metallopeptidase [SAR324 cluster bacterium]MBP45347.1 creatininase [Deltaproteobacteria bacterium]MDP6249072.1 M24 family metallopeptidase [SAR324 cluster bacterium]MDP6463163.1 M24 family metallopeptidase [SAR324 cluster bacterium]|tara:strand:- start:2148 stop:3356 length:1209 start_codon:yes stop_codon:yes gene_type:complete
MEQPKTLNLENGEKLPSIFSSEEMQSRLSRLREQMEKEGIEGVLFTSFHNINYFDHFVYTAFGRNYGLAVTLKRICSITANIDGGQPWRRGVGDNLVYTDWKRGNFFVAVQELLQGSRTVGVEYDHLSLQILEKLKAALPGTDFVDISETVMHQRMIKSEEEIELIRNGAQVADIGGQACVDALAEGVPEYIIARHSTHSMVQEIAKRYPDSDLMDTWTWFQSGINTDGAHNPLTTRQLEKGDILSLNCFPMIGGYYTALERTLFLDHASDEHLRLWEINCRVHERGLQLIQPGMRCCDIAMELNEIFAEHDLLQYRTFGYGHSFGSLSHYYGREAGLEFREDIETILEPGMVVSMEPMIMLPEGLPGAGGYREHDILLVTGTGSENLTGFPFGPEHNIIRK